MSRNRPLPNRTTTVPAPAESVRRVQQTEVGALALLHPRKLSALPLVDNDRRPVGMVHMHDFLRAGVM